jgi:hypothetical protein
LAGIVTTTPQTPAYFRRSRRCGVGVENVWVFGTPGRFGH